MIDGLLNWWSVYRRQCFQRYATSLGIGENELTENLNLVERTPIEQRQGVATSRKGVAYSLAREAGTRNISATVNGWKYRWDIQL